MTDPRSQAKYQIRFDWGVEGANAIASGAHIVVWADALPGGTANPTSIAHDGAILTGTVGARTAIADWVLARQVELGDRAIVAVVAAGGADGRFCVEDLIAAGAVIDALGDVGIDYTSPEAAAAVGAYSGLRNAAAHVLSASVTGQEILAADGVTAIEAAKLANASTDFVVLKEFSLGA